MILTIFPNYISSDIIQILPLLLACFAALLAGFVDAVAGGGGLIQVPSLLILFPDFAFARVVATNRFASLMGTSLAASQYSRKVELPWRAVAAMAAGAAIFSFTGAQILSRLPTTIMKPVVLCVMIVIVLYTWFNKRAGTEERLRVEEKRLPYILFALGAATGLYNGLIGPGTGTLMTFGLVGFVGFGFLRGLAITKIVNATADVSSLVMFILDGQVHFPLALPMMACNMTGAWLGSRMAMLHGNAFVRRMFMGVILLLIARFGYDLAKNF